MKTRSGAHLQILVDFQTVACGAQQIANDLVVDLKEGHTQEELPIWVLGGSQQGIRWMSGVMACALQEVMTEETH